MRTIIDADKMGEWINKCIDESHDAFGNLINKSATYRQGYRQALVDVLYKLHCSLENEFVPREYAVDIRDIEKKFDEAAKDENLAPIVRLAVGTAKHIVLKDNNDICMPIA